MTRKDKTMELRHHTCGGYEMKRLTLTALILLAACGSDDATPDHAAREQKYCDDNGVSDEVCALWDTTESVKCAHGRLTTEAPNGSNSWPNDWPSSILAQREA